MAHILEAIERIDRYTEDMVELVFLDNLMRPLRRVGLLHSSRNSRGCRMGKWINAIGPKY
ncbi:hypothetical protein D3872_23395 [Massilia cavernae]|uniref:Uncharacterized protein n=1 Tax=Massilia cavernae TaxID=2320864 RepID=A0A418X830_9BURK|nr:hypothetical protein D3872_23395 [Massilia cavernae]